MATPRCFLPFVTAAMVVAAIAAFPTQAANPKPRCAIIISRSEPTGNIIADLLAVELTKKGYSVVDREHLQRTLGERVLAQAFAAGETSARRKIGQIVGADLLILLSCRTKDKNKAVVWSVASMPDGLRLASGGTSWNEQQPSDALSAILNSIERAEKLSANDSLKIVCVPPFICRNPTFDHSGMQQSLKRLTEELLMQMPGVVVVALDEVDALTTESKFTNTPLARGAPIYIVGEFETKRTTTGLRTTLDIELRTSEMSIHRKQISDLDDDLASALTATLAELLAANVGVQPAASSTRESDTLAAHARALVRIGEWKDAIPLLKTAALLNPDDLEVRRLIFLTWNGLVTSTARPEQKRNPGYRVELMEHTLDAFEEMVRRRPVVRKDLYALGQFRAHGHLYYSVGSEVMAQYSAFNRRHRRLLRGIIDGKYGPLETKTRTAAIKQLISRLAADRYRSQETVYDEMIVLLHELAANRSDEIFVFHVLRVANHSRDSFKAKDDRFWRECCPANMKRLRALNVLAESISRIQTRSDRLRFDSALERVVEELELPKPLVDAINLSADHYLHKDLDKLAQTSATPLTQVPKFRRIKEAPPSIMHWIAGPCIPEFVATKSAVYRITPDRTFEVVCEVPNPWLAWDSERVWIVADDSVLVVEPDGTIVTRFAASGRKSITPFAPGKAFIARHDTNEHGGRRAAYEIWTLTTGERPVLEQELINVGDGNWTFGINKFKHRPGPRIGRLGAGYTIPGADGDAGLMFFNSSQRMCLDLNTYKFRRSLGVWPRWCRLFEHDGSFYLFVGFAPRGSIRTRAILEVDHPDHDPRLLADLGWQRNYRGIPGDFSSRVRSILVQGDWMHVLRRQVDDPPHWSAVNLVTGDVRALVMDFRRDFGQCRRLVTSQLFGMVVLTNGHSFRVELPPPETWMPYDEAVADLKVPEGEAPEAPWARWRESGDNKP